MSFYEDKTWYETWMVVIRRYILPCIVLSNESEHLKQIFQHDLSAPLSRSIGNTILIYFSNLFFKINLIAKHFFMHFFSSHNSGIIAVNDDINQMR